VRTALHDATLLAKDGEVAAVPPAAPADLQSKRLLNTYRVAVGVKTAGIRWQAVTTATQQLAVLTHPVVGLHRTGTDEGGGPPPHGAGGGGGGGGGGGVRAARRWSTSARCSSTSRRRLPQADINGFLRRTD
jgi:uncharacterized membrane protein YgcG